MTPMFDRIIDKGYPLFLYGPFLYEEVIEAVFGYVPMNEPADLLAHELFTVPGKRSPIASPVSSKTVPGRAFNNLSKEDWIVINAFVRKDYRISRSFIKLEEDYSKNYSFVANKPLGNSLFHVKGWDQQFFEDNSLKGFIDDCLKFRRFFDAGFMKCSNNRAIKTVF